MSSSNDSLYGTIIRTTTVVLLLSGSFANEDEYVNDAKATCYKTQETYSCLKYRTLRYISTVVGDDSWTRSINATNQYDERPIKLVHMKDYRQWGASPENISGYFEETRELREDSEVDRFVKFGKRQIESFLKSYGLNIGLPDGAVAISQPALNDEARSSDMTREARGKKKKLAILLPLLSLLSLFKVKLLLVPILLTVLFIKKLLVLAALFLPTILSTLKICKVPPPVHNQWAAGELAADVGGYGGAGYSPYGVSGGAHSKDWGASRAYSAYKPLYGQQNYKTVNDLSSPSYVMPNNNYYSNEATSSAV